LHIYYQHSFKYKSTLLKVRQSGFMCVFARAEKAFGGVPQAKYILPGKAKATKH